MPREDPVSSLCQMALDIGRFADILESATNIDARVRDHRRACRLDIAAPLDGSAAGP